MLWNNEYIPHGVACWMFVNIYFSVMFIDEVDNPYMDRTYVVFFVVLFSHVQILLQSYIIIFNVVFFSC